MTLDAKSHILFNKTSFFGHVVSIAVLAIIGDTSALAQQSNYGETQIGYPAPRASETTKSFQQGSVVIPATSIADEPDAATLISQLPAPGFPRLAQNKPQNKPHKSSLPKATAKAAAKIRAKLKNDAKTKLLAGLKPKATRRMRQNLRMQRRAGSYQDKNRIQANLKGVAIDGMSSINYQRLLGKQLALGVAAQHFQYLTPQGEGQEQGSGIGGKVFARVKPFRSRRTHEGIFVNMGLGMMAMSWEQTAAVVGGGERVNEQQGLYRTLTGGVSYQTPIYGSLLIEPRFDYVLFNPVDSDSSKAVQRFEPTVALGFGF